MSRLATWLPILDWGRSYRRATLGNDLLAALSSKDEPWLRALVAGMPPKAAEALLELVRLNGGAEVIERARARLPALPPMACTISACPGRITLAHSSRWASVSWCTWPPLATNSFIFGPSVSATCLRAQLASGRAFSSFSRSAGLTARACRLRWSNGPCAKARTVSPRSPAS